MVAPKNDRKVGDPPVWAWTNPSMGKVRSIEGGIDWKNNVFETTRRVSVTFALARSDIASIGNCRLVVFMEI